MATNSKEDLLALLSRETRFDKIQSKRKQKFMSLVSEEERTLAAEWMLEVVIDSGLKLDIFLLSVTIMDSFLDCCPILTNQVQLLASAALRLAAKVRDKMTINEAQIIEYTDNSITQTELEAWEMLVLSKLDWDVNFVIALDYLEPLFSFCKMPQVETNELKNLICTLSSRYATFRAIYSARVVALASLKKQPQTQILEMFQISLETVENCQKHFVQRSKTPPNSLSPLKAESTSTPKGTRSPLRENSNRILNTRRRLTSLNTSEEAKENNDSAIGLLAEPLTPSSSQHSSKQSSPDSGASSGGNKSPKNTDELDKLLENTRLTE